MISILFTHLSSLISYDSGFYLHSDEPCDIDFRDERSRTQFNWAARLGVWGNGNRYSDSGALHMGSLVPVDKIPSLAIHALPPGSKPIFPKCATDVLAHFPWPYHMVLAVRNTILAIHEW